MSFETTTHVRVLRGSAPTDGSQFTQTISPRRMLSLGALLVIEEPLELRALEIAKHVPGIFAAGGVVRGQLAAVSQGFSLLDRLAEQAPRTRRDRDLLARGVPPEPGEGNVIECQVQTTHDTSIRAISRDTKAQ